MFSVNCFDTQVVVSTRVTSRLGCHPGYSDVLNSSAYLSKMRQELLLCQIFIGKACDK